MPVMIERRGVEWTMCSSSPFEHETSEDVTQPHIVKMAARTKSFFKFNCMLFYLYFSKWYFSRSAAFVCSS